MGDIIIRTDNLAVGYGEALIKDICLEVRGGEIMTLIGPNGSGKSTILKTLAGSLKKIGGAVYIDDIDYSSLGARDMAKKLSMLLTERVRASLMTCREVVETGRYPYTGYFGALSDRDKKAVEEAILLVDIGEYADSYFTEISDGQRQRVMLARAICQEPEILILDEPTSYLDIHHKIAFIEILRKLAKEKQIAVIMSMHEIDFVREISDYTVCIKDGKVLKQGRTDEVLSGGTIKELFNISEEMYKRYFTSKERK